MKRSQLIMLCLWLTILCSLGAVATRLIRFPDGQMKDMFIMISPIFFGIAAKNGTRLGRAATVVALIGLVFAGAALFAAITSKVPTPPT